MRLHLDELEKHLSSLDAPAKLLLKNLYIEERLSKYDTTRKQPHRFILVVDKNDTSHKLSKLDPEVVMARLLRVEKAARTIQTKLRSIVLRCRKLRAVRFHSILRTLTLHKLREKVEMLGTTRYKKLLQIKGMVVNQRATKLAQEKLRIGLQTLQKTVFEGFLRRAGFAIYIDQNKH